MKAEYLKEFKAYLWKRWIIDVVVRTIKTGAEVFAGFLTVDALVSINEIDWLRALSVTAVSMLYTVLINIYKIASDIEKANEMEVKEDEKVG